MATSFQHIKGYKEVDDNLRKLPLKLAKNVVRGGLRAGAAAMRKVVLDKVPVGPTNEENIRLYGGYEGALRDSVHVITGVDGTRIWSAVVAGGTVKKNGAEVFYGHMLEYGTAAHLIAPSTKGVLAPSIESEGFAGELFWAHVDHPGQKPTYFMTRSLTMGEKVFVDAVRAYMTARIDKELLK